MISCRKYRALLQQISTPVADSAEKVKHSSVDAADEQLKEIKELRREEPKAFKRNGNEIQCKFIARKSQKDQFHFPIF